jgi:hypothetical protein
MSRDEQKRARSHGGGETKEISCISCCTFHNQQGCTSVDKTRNIPRAHPLQLPPFCLSAGGRGGCHLAASEARALVGGRVSVFNQNECASHEAAGAGGSSLNASSRRGLALRPVNHRRPSSSASRSSASSSSASRSPSASSSSASRARATSIEPAPTWTLAQEPIRVP